MNKALIAKLGWRLLKEKDSLWAVLLRSKYRVGDAQNLSWLISKGHWSATWRSIGTGLREVVFPGLCWVLGNGRQIKFWSDKWLSDSPLQDSVTMPLPDGYGELRVHELWIDGFGWDLPRIAPFVSANTRLQLAARVLDNVTGGKDRIAWGECSDGRFTVKSAYNLLIRDRVPKQRMQQFFDRIWRVVAPERVKIFLWLVANQVLMTNMERYRRHLCNSGLCQVCKSGNETIIHILRDCPAMTGVWHRLGATMKVHGFFELSILEWLYANLGQNSDVSGAKWSTLFAISAWWGWKWRCGNVFGSNNKCRDRVRFLKDYATEVSLANSVLHSSEQSVVREDRLIKWSLPTEGWFKLNTDGASHGNPGLATAGGVLRDGEGNWCGGFALNIGICTAPMAELWGVYYGLCIAWERRATRVELEVDSEIVVGFLTSGINDSHPLSFLVRLCYGFLSRDWLVRISHVYREANRLADGLANYAFSLSLGLHIFESTPVVVNSIVLEDVAGFGTSRRVRV